MQRYPAQRPPEKAKILYNSVIMEPMACAPCIEYRPELLSRRGEYAAWGKQVRLIGAYYVRQ